MSTHTPDQVQRAHRFYRNIKVFVKDVLCNDEIGPEDFIPGTQRVEFFDQLLPADHRIHPHDHSPGGVTYEEALLARITQRNEMGTLVLLGGLGAGKTTAIRYVFHLLRQRRPHLATSKCEEQCPTCTQEPLYVNCIGIDRDIGLPDALATVTQKIRNEIYEEMLRQWLRRTNQTHLLLEDEPTVQTIRRLIITNDLRIWAAQNRVSLGLDTPPELDAKTTILGLTPDAATLEQLSSKFEHHLVRLDGWLGRMHNNQRDNLEFTIALLRFYLSKCPAHNPFNFMVVDNLDALPTRHIEEIAKMIQKLATNNPAFLVVLPLRPSSILVPGHVRTTEVWYHYGPSCYLMLLRRLERYVLARKTSELRSTEVSAKGAFIQEPSDEELNFFLVATYLYAQILAVATPEGAEILQAAIRNHPLLSRVRVPEGAARSIAATLGALVGTCARYANEQLERYFASIYFDSAAIFETLARLGHEGAHATLSVPYRLIMDTIVFDTSSAVPVAEHIANLYSPTRRAANDRLPSLTKIRILKFLKRWKRPSVREVVRHLSLYGIPAEVAIEALNSLHDKDRLLLVQ